MAPTSEAAPPQAAPAEAEARPLTRLLNDWQAGQPLAFARLLAWVQGELLRRVQSRLRGAEPAWPGGEDLLQQALLKLLARPLDWHDRQHFFATVSLAMRKLLVEHARHRQAARPTCGAAWQLADVTAGGGEPCQAADLLTLDQLLQQLDEEDPRAAQVVQLTCFLGLAREDIALLMSLSVAAVDRELCQARAWLSARLGRAGIGA